MSFILNYSSGIAIVLALISFVSIAFEKRITSFLISLTTVLLGSFIFFYAFYKMTGFDVLDVYIKGLMIIGEGLILLVVMSIVIVTKESKKKTG
ncbi:hypothetical protein [Priestia megaterium]